MNNTIFTHKVLSLPHSKRKKAIRLAKIGIALLFVSVMTCTAIAGWFLFTSPNKLLSALCLVILGIASFMGGRLHGCIHSTESLLVDEAQTSLENKHSAS